MTNDELISTTRWDSPTAQAVADEMLEALLDSDSIYPWNPTTPEAEAYFLELERQFPVDDILADELPLRSQQFFNTLDFLWSQTTVVQRFVERVPQPLLSALATKAQQVLQMNLSLAEQLVQCAQAVLPHWSPDDLHILARPLAYAMRGSEIEQAYTLETVNPAVWVELSEIEQARLSLAIAYYTLNQLQTSDSES